MSVTCGLWVVEVLAVEEVVVVVGGGGGGGVEGAVGFRRRSTGSL